MAGKEEEEEKNVIVIEVGLKEVFYASLLIASIALVIFLLLEYSKPRLNLRAELLQNKTVIISGRLIAEFSPIPDEYIAIEVRSEEGVTVWIDAVKTSDEGYFKSVFLLNEDARVRFDVYANARMVSEKASFSTG